MKGRLHKLVLFVLLGAITTVAVAWASGAWLRLRWFDEYAVGRTTPDDSGWFLRAYKRPGAQLVVGYLISDVTDIWHGNEWREDNLSSAEIDWPNVFEHSMEPRPPFIRTKTVNARGWPWPCLYSEFIEARSLKPPRYEGPEVRGGAYWEITLSGYTLSVVDSLYAVLPWRPIWLGFVLDIATFGGLWASIFVFGHHIRKRWSYLTSRSIIVALITSGVLGVVTTNAVVWYCAIWVDETFEEGGGGDAYGVSENGLNYVHWSVNREVESAAVRLTSCWRFKSISINSGSDGLAEEFVPSWGEYLIPTDRRRAQEDGLTDRHCRVVDARGWPMLAMWGGFEFTRHAEDGIYVYALDGTKHAIVLPRLSDGGVFTHSSRVIPLAPIWPGYVVNTVLYTVIWLLFLLLVVGPGIIPRTIRHVQSRCINCGYDLRGTAQMICSECGYEVRAEAGI